jgi:tetratricopeptide (TPR) repeat protein
LSQQTTIILYGPEGIGKTRLAVEYVAQHGSRYSEVFWVDGTTKESVHRSIASFSTHLHAQAGTYKTAGAITAQSMQHEVNNLLAWFSQPSNTGWLLILDNVESGPGEEAYNILEYFPKARHGSILVTTRLAELANVGRGLPVPPMNGEQGRHLLESVRGASVPDVERLVSALDGHPLALVLAGAYLGLHPGSLEDYMDMQHSSGKLIEASPSLSCQGPNYQFAWQVAFHQVSKDNLYATRLIELWACLSNTDMWFELLAPDLKNVSQIPDWLYSVVSDRSLFLQSMQTLADHALIEHQKHDGCYTMHPALHQWCFNQLQNKEQMVLNAIVILGTATPGDEEPTLEQLAIEHRLSPHLDRIVSLLHYVPPAPNIPRGVQEILASCFYDIAETYRHQRKLGEAEQLFQRAYQFYESVHGADHRETLRSLHILGWVYAEQENLVRAEETYRRVLKGKASKYGPDHAFLSNTALNLGNIYKRTNRVDEAEAMFKRALRGYETVLGPTNPATLDVTYSLGVLYCEQARTAEAEQMLLAAIQGYDANSGPGTGTGTEPESTDTLKAVNSLGCLYLQNPRRIHEAEALLKRALHGRERVLGLRAEDTLQTIQNLGVLYMFQAKNHEAERMYNRAWQGYESIFGGSAAAERHVPALRVILSLAFLESCRMRMGKARELATRVLLAAQALEPSLDAAKLSQDALAVLTRLASL